MNKKTEARCNGLLLTVGFHTANPPLIWRFDLERNHSFTLAMHGEEGEWDLGVTSPKGEFYPIAHFDAREDAEEALQKVEKVLTPTKRLMSAIMRFIAILIIGFLLVTIAIPLGAMSFLHKAVGSPANVSHTAPIENGVPLSADDILKSQQ